jgi:hypothetical protein
MKWTKKQLEKFWDNLPKEKQKAIGSFKNYCDGIINEED